MSSKESFQGQSAGLPRWTGVSGHGSGPPLRVLYHSNVDREEDPQGPSLSRGVHGGGSSTLVYNVLDRLPPSQWSYPSPSVPPIFRSLQSPFRTT